MVAHACVRWSVVVVWTCVVGLGSAAAQPAGDRAARAAALADLTNRLIAGAQDQARSNGRTPSPVLGSLAAERAQLLANLVHDAPEVVLQSAIPSDVRASLPDAIRDLTEERVSVSGTLEVAYEDHPRASRLQYVLATGAGRYHLRFASNFQAPTAWRTGDRLAAQGVRVGSELALGADGATSVEGLASSTALADASGAQRVLVMLVNFRNHPVQPYTASQASEVVFGATDAYLREVSGGITSLSGDVFGWFTIAMDDTVCDTATVAALAEEAAVRAGADLAQYGRRVYAFPQNACTWWGRGSVGGSPSQAWVNGTLALDVAGHELGHNLGLYHSKSLDCGPVTLGSTCTADEYGDVVDLMGASKGHYNAFQKERLGWLAPSQILNVTDTGTYTIEPYETLTGGTKALKILKSTDPSTGARTYYYVEFRQALGADAFMSGWTNVMSGVSVHTGAESNANSSYLLDMTPETSTWYDPALTGGRTFSDGASGVTVTTVATSALGATVSVTTPGAAVCSRVSPSVTLAPDAPAPVAAGTAVAYLVSLANHDSGGCPQSSFTLASTVPSGWTASFDAPALTLEPGSSGTATMRVTSPGTATSGTFTVSTRATDSATASRSATGSASYTVAPGPAPSLQITTNQTSYSRGSTVTATALLTVGGVPGTGAAVTFVFRKANGTTTTSSAVTDTTGRASAQLRLRAKDPAGTYQVTATSGSATASTTFTVR